MSGPRVVAASSRIAHSPYAVLGSVVLQYKDTVALQPPYDLPTDYTHIRDNASSAYRADVSLERTMLKRHEEQEAARRKEAEDRAARERRLAPGFSKAGLKPTPISPSDPVATDAAPRPSEGGSDPTALVATTALPPASPFAAVSATLTAPAPAPEGGSPTLPPRTLNSSSPSRDPSSPALLTPLDATEPPAPALPARTAGAPASSAAIDPTPEPVPLARLADSELARLKASMNAVNESSSSYAKAPPVPPSPLGPSAAGVMGTQPSVTSWTPHGAAPAVPPPPPPLPAAAAGPSSAVAGPRPILGMYPLGGSSASHLTPSLEGLMSSMMHLGPVTTLQSPATNAPHPGGAPALPPKPLVALAAHVAATPSSAGSIDPTTALQQQQYVQLQSRFRDPARAADCAFAVHHIPNDLARQSAFVEAVAKVMDVGFTDVTLVRRTLLRFDLDVERTVDDLLTNSVSN
ncbi:hypothetical protein CXG81DRAFT_17470 [Caulochytrium protostelioides]|uniref:UBA domain-containing protein n=1 Tax=Caulochytrium protostelioides TaxID=1555241 RepID=A0A4P9XC03_9FUNG|nr:hypothetical protein CXG81DRAFT_17470 [Caulochytrium protostelioides]|eukprot:RKP02948.1 hypothetical protein CXG81DRAFT_17470 [Caulochytrium protostelioides]